MGMFYLKPDKLRLTAWPLSADRMSTFQQLLLKRPPKPDESQLVGFMFPSQPLQTVVLGEKCGSLSHPYEGGAQLSRCTWEVAA